MYNYLNSKSDFLTEFHPVAELIEKLADGGRKLNGEEYLLIRDQENKAITKARVRKFAPRNVLGAALKYLRMFQESGTINIDIETLPGNPSLWSGFINNVDGSETTLKEFVINVFESALKTKYAFVKVDLPYIEIPENLNVYLAETLTNNRIPYLSEISLLDVLNFEEENGKIKWIKYRHIQAVESPTSNTKYNYNICLIDDEHITTFVYEDVKLDSDKNITKIFDTSLNRGTGGYRRIKNSENPTRTIELSHNRGVCPVIKLEIPDALWQSNQVYKTQAVLHGLNMNMTHTLANAGFIQKWGKPYLISPDMEVKSRGSGIKNDPNDVAVGELNHIYLRQLGDEAIMFMDEFSFEEIQGSSIKIQDDIIQKMCDYVFNTIIYKQNILDNTSKVMTGTAKEFDREAQVLALKANGRKIIGLTQQILKQVALCFPGVSEVDTLSISVEGMNEFNLRPVSTALEIVERLCQLPSDKMPSELLKKALEHLAIAMTENDNQEQKQIILDAIKRISPV